ncbi:magnesium/cobalt transporter CorA [Brevibacillus sp. SYP-B805]|uniref:magnesium/cobalt transporter CorA n=1 Tax=Brevibacillus sp. SYP-B805 TaxID=1578199 RepID=UPI001F4995E4|nr:magnesium/cobalt transporter CorA [Brevibacillus sp. SYP-B805]
MIHTLAATQEGTLLFDLPIDRLNDPDIAWYWVDFDQPAEQETNLLADFFRFHPLAIEDCLHFLQRPKLDHYDGYTFFVVHALNQMTMEAEEVDLFVGSRFVVSFHKTPSAEIELIRSRIRASENHVPKGPLAIAYTIMDKLVDNYFPTMYKLEDELGEIEENTQGKTIRQLMDQLFRIRGELLHLRRTIVPMRDLLYRIINSESLSQSREQRAYFTDIYDHLLKLTEMLESNREMTADMRDSYLSLNSNRMNSIMMTLTVITTIFMPLTFIAGIYGMNFSYMPELNWRYGYFAVLGVMAVVGFSMYAWFRKKGWFDNR